MKVKSLSRVRLFETPWTAAYQAPPSMGFSRQEYWSGVPLSSPVNWYSHYEYRMESLSKIKHKLTIPLLDNFLKKTKTLIEKDICSPMFIAALFTTANIQKNLSVHH